jgi:hypothetical protein
MTPLEFFEALRTHVAQALPSRIPVGFNKAPDQSIDYVVIWPAPGTPVDDPTVNNLMGTEATALDFQVTAVSDQPIMLLQIMQRLTAALTETMVARHLVRPDVITNRAVRPLRDETRTPVRHYMVTTWQTTLTR